MIELRSRLCKIAIAATVNDVNVLTSMRVIKAEMMLLQCGGIGSAAGTAGHASYKYDEDKVKQNYGDSLQEAKPPNEKSRDRVTRKKNWRDISSLQGKMVKGEIGD